MNKMVYSFKNNTFSLPAKMMPTCLLSAYFIVFVFCLFYATFVVIEKFLLYL